MAIKIKRKVQFTLTAVFGSEFAGQTVHATIYNAANKEKQRTASGDVDSSTLMATFTFSASDTAKLEEGMASLDLYKTENDQPNGSATWMATAEKFATVINVSVS